MYANKNNIEDKLTLKISSNCVLILFEHFQTIFTIPWQFWYPR